MKARLANGRAEKRCDGAFTLVELLVVVAVIGILAALLLPALGRAKAKADGVVCRGNLRQMGIGWHLYLSDYNAYPPEQVWHSHGDINGTHFWADDAGLWHAQLSRYVAAQWPKQPSGNLIPDRPGAKPGGLFVCPGYLRLGNVLFTGTYGFNQSGLAVDLQIVSGWALDRGLGLGGQMTGPPDPHTQEGTGYIPTSEKMVRAPSEMIALGDVAVGKISRPHPSPGQWDGIIILNGDGNTLMEGINNIKLWPAMLPLIQQRHSGRFNMLFCDGHTEALPLNRLWDLRNADVMARWNSDHLPHRELPVWR